MLFCFTSCFEAVHARWTRNLQRESCLPGTAAKERWALEENPEVRWCEAWCSPSPSKLVAKAVLVYIRLAVGAARDFRTSHRCDRHHHKPQPFNIFLGRNGPEKPPFTRVTVGGLLAGEPRVTIAWDDGAALSPRVCQASFTCPPFWSRGDSANEMQDPLGACCNYADSPTSSSAL